MEDTKMDGKSLDITKMNIEALKELFPDVVEEDKVDFDKLRTILGEEVDDSDERYNFTWHGKNQAIRISQTPSMGTLRPCKNKSVDWDNTKNIYIEGDNLEVLKLLQKSYFGKVKIIYIDPPYNTGKDFVYKDKFADNLSNYKIITKQIDSKGNNISTNNETDGRFYTNWLNMMYPRLRLARNLLSDDGVIFISIDDHEINDLKKICDEIWGINNFVANLVWTNKEGGGGSDSKFFKIKHEYILCYAKKIDCFLTKNVEIEDRDRYKLSDEYESSRGKYQLVKLSSASIQYSPSLDYPIEMPDGSFVNPVDNSDKNRSCWRWSKQKLQWGLDNNFVVYKKDKNNIWQVYTKQYTNCDKDGNICPRTKIPSALIDQFSSTQASNHLIKLLGGKYFSYPKPVELLEWLIDRIPSNDCIVMDFFAGSATTAEAVYNLNIRDAGSRRYILIQLDEPIDPDSDAYKAGYRSLCDVSVDRIKNVRQLLKKTMQIQQLTLDDTTYSISKNTDLGFKHFKLDTSNIKKWSGQTYDIQQSLESFENNILSDSNRSDYDLLYELLLKLGLSLNSMIELFEVNSFPIYSVCNGALMVYLGNINSVTIADVMISLYRKEQPEIWKVVFKDIGFSSDSVKANVKETLKAAGLAEDSFITL